MLIDYCIISKLLFIENENNDEFYFLGGYKEENAPQGKFIGSYILNYKID
jgi:hypothetical protein